MVYVYPLSPVFCLQSICCAIYRHFAPFAISYSFLFESFPLLTKLNPLWTWSFISGLFYIFSLLQVFELIIVTITLQRGLPLEVTGVHRLQEQVNKILWHLLYHAILCIVFLNRFYTSGRKQKKHGTLRVISKCTLRCICGPSSNYNLERNWRCLVQASAENRVNFKVRFGCARSHLVKLWTSLWRRFCSCCSSQSCLWWKLHFKCCQNFIFCNLLLVFCHLTVHLWRVHLHLLHKPHSLPIRSTSLQFLYKDTMWDHIKSFA